MAEKSNSLWDLCCNPRYVAVMRPSSEAHNWSPDGQFLVPQSGPARSFAGSRTGSVGSGSPLKPAPTVVENHTTDQLVGVGIVFESTRSGQTGLVVASLASGGSAMLSGQVAPGDELVGVDGTDVRHLDPAQLAPLILGRQGSQVRMDFTEQGTGKEKVVTLARSYIMRR